MRNSEERWLELLADNTEGELPLNRTLFICHWAVAETAAKMVNSILFYMATSANVDLRAEAEPVENWEHEGFSKAFSGENQQSSQNTCGATRYIRKAGQSRR